MFLEVTKATLEAQLQAVCRLRKQPAVEPAVTSKGRSQVDMAFDILKEAGGEALHVNEIIVGIHERFNVQVDRESLVSSLTKKVLRQDRFVRTSHNTFGLLIGSSAPKSKE